MTPSIYQPLRVLPSALLLALLAAQPRTAAGAAFADDTVVFKLHQGQPWQELRDSGRFGLSTGSAVISRNRASSSRTS